MNWKEKVINYYKFSAGGYSDTLIENQSTKAISIHRQETLKQKVWRSIVSFS